MAEKELRMPTMSPYCTHVIHMGLISEKRLPASKTTLIVANVILSLTHTIFKCNDFDMHEKNQHTHSRGSISNRVHAHWCTLVECSILSLVFAEIFMISNATVVTFVANGMWISSEKDVIWNDLLR